MELEPWEALDVDDSDLSSFLRPCKRRHHDSPPKTTNSAASSQSQPVFQLNLRSSLETLTNSPSKLISPQSEPAAPSPRLIPGPAGSVQAAMQQRARGDRRLPGSPEEEEPVPTQEFIRRVVENGHESDLDFNTNAWLCALDFVRRQGMVDGDCVTFGTPLRSIKKHLNIERVAQVVAVIKSCTPNGFGDTMVTLKDPTSTIGASVHRKVFTKGEFRKDITVGSVLVLQKVALFSPTRSACYLNITLHNIVKVFPKDSGPPSEQIYPARSVRHTTPSIERNDKSWMLSSTFSLPQERTEGIMNNLRLDSRFREVDSIDKQKGENLVLSSYHSDNGNSRNKNVVLDKENLSLRQGSARPMEVTCGGELDREMGDQPNPSKLSEGDNPVCSAQSNRSSTNSVHTSDGQETGIKNPLEKQREILNPKSSIPRWTEEQLDELLAFD